MSHEKFNPNTWRLKKYEGETVSLLSPDEYRTRLHQIETQIRATILKAQAEFKEDLGVEYDIVGAGIYGSWVRGDPHTKSDLDLFTISAEDPVDLGWDFVNRLHRANIGMEIDYLGNCIYTDPRAARRFLRDNILKGGVQIVTPHPEVETIIRSLIGKANR